MIEVLQGEIIYKEDNKVIVSCYGVGYGIHISSHCYSHLGEVGDTELLYVILKVKEDDMSLFGFKDQKEKEMFVLLESVNKIGSKTAIQILSQIRFEKLAVAISQKDIVLLSSVKGVGKKTAERIVIELKDKVLNLSTISSNINHLSNENTNHIESAIAALIKLGFRDREARSISEKISKDSSGNLDVGEIIKRALALNMQKK